MPSDPQAPLFPDVSAIYGVILEDRAPMPGTRSLRIVADGATALAIHGVGEWVDEGLIVMLQAVIVKHARRPLLQLIR